MDAIYTNFLNGIRYPVKVIGPAFAGSGPGHRLVEFENGVRIIAPDAFLEPVPPATGTLANSGKPMHNYCEERNILYRHLKGDEPPHPEERAYSFTRIYIPTRTMWKARVAIQGDGLSFLQLLIWWNRRSDWKYAPDGAY